MPTSTVCGETGRKADRLRTVKTSTTAPRPVLSSDARSGGYLSVNFPGLTSGASLVPSLLFPDKFR